MIVETKVMKILRFLSMQRQGATVRQIFKALPDMYDLHVLQVYLSILVRRKKLKKDGKLECPHCGGIATCYRISDEGWTYFSREAA